MGELMYKYICIYYISTCRIFLIGTSAWWRISGKWAVAACKEVPWIMNNKCYLICLFCRFAFSENDNLIRWFYQISNQIIAPTGLHPVLRKNDCDAGRESTFCTDVIAVYTAPNIVQNQPNEWEIDGNGAKIQQHSYYRAWKSNWTSIVSSNGNMDA